MFEFIYILGSLMTGFAVAVTANALLDAQAAAIDSDTKRLIQSCEFYQFFARWIEDLKAFFKPRIKSHTSVWSTMLRVTNVESYLRRGEDTDQWDVNSWISREVFRCGLKWLVASCLLLLFMSPLPALLFGGLLGYFQYLLAQIRLTQRSKSWNSRFHQRLPFSIDLIALTMKAGSTIDQSLKAVLEENHGHPIGDEFEIITQQHQNGTPLLECFENFRDRMSDKDVNEIVFTAINAERYGGANADTYLRLADQMRIRRSQRAEKAIGEAKTMMALPNFLFFLAGLLAIAGPTVLQLWESVQKNGSLF